MKTLVNKDENLKYLCCLLNSDKINDKAIYSFVNIYNKSVNRCTIFESLVTEHILKVHTGISEKYKRLNEKYQIVFFIKYLKKEKHWIVIEWKNKTFTLFDNFPWPKPKPKKEKYFQILHQLSSALLQGTSKQDISLHVKMSYDLPITSVQNIDDSNCAIHVILNILCLSAQNNSIVYNHIDVKKAREKMLKTILEGKLSQFFLRLMVQVFYLFYISLYLFLTGCSN